MSNSWFKRGDEGASQAKMEDERRQAMFDEDKVRRFWLAPDKSTQITFLDTEGFFLSEHQLYLNGSWMNWFTCLKDITEDGICPLCESGNNYSYVCAFTIIDHTKFTTKKGTKIKATKKLIVFKATARNKILKQKERRDGDLTGCKFEVTRYSKKEAATGEDFEFLQRVDMEEFGQALLDAGVIPDGESVEDFLKPYDYEKIFAPKSVEELRAILGEPAPVGSQEERNTSSDDNNPSGPARRGIGDLV